jgi:hypothetical protein
LQLKSNVKEELYHCDPEQSVKKNAVIVSLKFHLQQTFTAVIASLPLAMTGVKI